MSATETQLGLGAGLKAAVTTTNKLLQDLVSPAIVQLGLQPGEADVLTVIRIAKHDPTPTEIADWLTLTTAGCSGRLNALEAKGLIERRPHADDGRRLTVHLSRQGRGQADKAIQTKNQVLMDGAVAAIGEQATQQLIAGLEQLIESLTTRTQPPSN